MICLRWNCRGLGSPRADNALKGVVRIENPHFFFSFGNKVEGFVRVKEDIKRGIGNVLEE